MLTSAKPIISNDFVAYPEFCANETSECLRKWTFISFDYVVKLADLFGLNLIWFPTQQSQQKSRSVRDTSILYHARSSARHLQSPD